MKDVILLFSLFLFRTLCFGQAIDSSRNAVGVKKKLPTISPSMSLQNPTGGGELGFVSAGLLIQNRTRLGNNIDGSAAAYIGLGEPDKFIGGGVGVNFYGLSNSRGELNNRGAGGINFHLDKLFFKKKLLLDIGVDNAYLWGEILSSGNYITYQRSFYFSANYLLSLNNERANVPFSYVSITAGAGNGYFRGERNYSNNNAGVLNPFFGVATPLGRSTNIIAEWNGYDIGTGISSIPFNRVPVMFSLEVTDLLYGKPRVNTTLSFPLQLFTINRKNKTLSDGRPVGVRAFRTVRTI